MSVATARTRATGVYWNIARRTCFTQAVSSISWILRREYTGSDVASRTGSKKRVWPSEAGDMYAYSNIRKLAKVKAS